jgi:predicted MFS family arabinose efflux permease
MLFGWGALIGVVGVLGSYAVGRRARIETNRWTAYRGFVVVSAVFAVVAAVLGSPWPLVTFASYVLIVNFAVPVVVLTRARQPAHACGADASCGATACSACPLAAVASK